jgi:hypothetical protein
VLAGGQRRGGRRPLGGTEVEVIRALSRAETWTEVRHLLPFLVSILAGAAYTIGIVYLARARARWQWERELVTHYDETVRLELRDRDKRIQDLQASLEQEKELGKDLMVRIRTGNMLLHRAAEALGTTQTARSGSESRTSGRER